MSGHAPLLRVPRNGNGVSLILRIARRQFCPEARRRLVPPRQQFSCQSPLRSTGAAASTTSSITKTAAMSRVPSIKLNDGHSIPLLAYGTGTAWFKSSGQDSGINRELVESIKMAIGLGYHHLDCAEVYGTESEVGIAIKESGVPREKLYVTTKVNQSMSDIPKGLEDSLKRLQLDYVDCYLIHQPFFAESDADLQRAWAAMESVKEAGKTRSIGVSNYGPAPLQATLAAARVPPAINQIEFHPYLQQCEWLAANRAHAVATSAYGALTAVTKARPGPADDVYARLARKYGVAEGVVALRWCLDQGIVAVTTSSKEARLREYLGVLDFALEPDEVRELADVGQAKHFRGFWTRKLET